MSVTGPEPCLASPASPDSHPARLDRREQARGAWNLHRPDVPPHLVIVLLHVFVFLSTGGADLARFLYFLQQNLGRSETSE